MTPTCEIRNSEPGGFTGEIALSQKRRGSEIQGIGRDEFAPYRTDYQLWRSTPGHPVAGSLISSGILTSLNFNFNRDTALVAGKDWLHYLQRRIYPFDPELYISGGWIDWPRQWPDLMGTHGPSHYTGVPDETPPPVDIGIILRELIQSMRFEPPNNLTLPSSGPIRTTQWPNDGVSLTNGVPRITQNIGLLGQETTYKIYPGDSTTIYDHIRKLSEQSEKGFEFDIHPLSLEFRVWSPRRDMQYLQYFTISPTEYEIDGAISEFDWTNEGPEGTYLIGLGSGEYKTGAVWTDIDNVFEFWRMDKVYDFGKVSDPDMLLQLLKDQNDLHPQKKLQLGLWNPEHFVLNFYTNGRPRNLIGQRIRVNHDFAPLHQVDAYFRINAIKWSIDKSTNENVALELEMVYEP